MSKVQVDTIVDKEDKSAPTLSKGAIVTGVCTATSFVGALTGAVTGNADTATTATTATNAQGLSGTPNISVGNVTSVNVTNSKQTTSEHVNITGVGTFGSDISVADNIVHTGNTNTAIKFASNSITLDSAGSLALHIDGSAKIGFGTNDPQKPVDVYGESSGQLRVSNSSKAADLICDSTGGLLRTIGSYPLVFNTNQTDRLRIGTSGDIGLAVASGVSTDYGTSGQVLTSAGSGSAVQWATVSAGSWSELTKGTFSSSDNQTKVLTTTHLTSSHKMYKLSMRFTWTQTQYYTGLQVYSGGAWKTSDYGMTWLGEVGGQTPSTGEEGSFARMQFGANNWYMQMYQVEMMFSDVDSTDRIKMFTYNSYAYDAHGGTSTQSSSVCNQLSTWRGSTAAITGLRVVGDPQGTVGTFDYGWFVLEGYTP